MLHRVTTFARRRPVAFLALCGVAGVLAGRLSRGAVASRTSLDTPSGDSTNRATAPTTPALTSDEVVQSSYTGPDFEQPRHALAENRSLSESTATEGWDRTDGDLGAGIPVTSADADYGRGAAR